jgi:hypothetical protein
MSPDPGLSVDDLHPPNDAAFISVSMVSGEAKYDDI